MEDLIAEKLDKLWSKMDSFDKKLDSVESKLDTRLAIVENKCSLLEKKSFTHDKQQSYVIKEIKKLKCTVNALEQQNLVKNIIIKGVIESEGDDLEQLSFMVDCILSEVYSDFESQSVSMVRRIGVKRGNVPRHILVKMQNTDIKLLILKSLKGKDLNCAAFNHNGKVWGSKDDKIYLNDHLTSTNNDIFFHARKMRNMNKIKYAWTKLGRIYIRKDDSSLARSFSSLEELSIYEEELGLKPKSSKEDANANSEVEITDTVVKQKSSNTYKRGDAHVSPLKTRSKRGKPQRIDT